MNDADDITTTKPEAARNSGLSAEDEVVAARWRAEVGADRLRRIAVALAAGRPGRKSEEADRWHLLLMMARLGRAHPGAKTNRLANMVVASPEGEAECLRSNVTKDALKRWLRDAWSKSSLKLKREIALAERRPSQFSVLKMFETIDVIKDSLENRPLPDWLQAVITGPTPPGLRAFMTSPCFEVLKAVLAPKDKVNQTAHDLLPLILGKTPAD